jgi:hypothetical protein
LVAYRATFHSGIGIGGDYPVSATIMSEYAGKNSRGMLVSLVFAMQAAGLILGPLFASRCWPHICRRISGIEEPELQPVSLEHGEVLAWFRYQSGAPLTIVTEPGKTEHKRHIRKYAEGDLGVGSFVFHGPDGRLSLVAQNLNTFIRMGQGVDDPTWEYHLRAGHFSEWFRLIVKDKELADQVRDLEHRDSPPQQSRKEVIAAICARYTLPE